MVNAEVEGKVVAYAQALLRSYRAAVEANFGALARELELLGQCSALFPLYGRQVGLDTGLVLFSGEVDFYLFFIDEPGVGLTTWRHAAGDDGFDREWTFNTPDEMRARVVREQLGLGEEDVLTMINVPGLNFIDFTTEAMVRDASHHGTGRANGHGARAEQQLPALRSAFQDAQVRAGFRASYGAMHQWSGTPQTRGIAFEKLWREVLGFHGWHPKKVTIDGEDDDFTAIRNGAHILGEVRWYAGPMTGGKAREFLAKFSPRPATTGLFISYTGYDDGARAVFRRAVGTTAVVLFGKDEIDDVLDRGADLGALFDVRLREVYDYLFEGPSKS